MFINVEKYLPHKSPFLFVDKVIEIKKKKKILAVKNVKISDFYFSGHFPSKPIVPGVIVIEALAQACGVLINVSLNLKEKYPDFYLCSIRKTKFKRKIIPPSVIYLNVEVKNIKKIAWKFFGRAFVNNKLVCYSEIVCAKENELYR